MVAIDGPENGLSVATRLAASMGLTLDWAGAWTPDAQPFDSGLLALFAEFETPPEVRFMHDAWSASMPTLVLNDVRGLVRAATCMWCVHWSPERGAFGDGSRRWLSYVDHAGYTHEDALVYSVELAYDCMPLSTDPSSGAFHFGPERASGWALHLVSVRDHMTADQLREAIADGASIPVDSIHKRRFA